MYEIRRCVFTGEVEGGRQVVRSEVMEFDKNGGVNKVLRWMEVPRNKGTFYGLYEIKNDGEGGTYLSHVADYKWYIAAVIGKMFRTIEKGKNEVCSTVER